MIDFRRANFLPLTIDSKRLDWLSAYYIDMQIEVPASRSFEITDPWVANLPGLAFNMYDDINLWWVLALYNGIVDPINDVYVGRTMRAPNKEDVVAYLADRRARVQKGSTDNTVTL